MSEWQDIETAPKDGTIIDVWHVCIDPEWRPEGEECRYTDVRWCETEEGEGWAVWDERWGDMVLLVQEPHYAVTHWMPLPPPPEARR